MNEPHLVAAIATHGPDYRPRAHHVDAAGAPRYTNRLILETSPYLLQHAHNPVDWRPWGDEAFAEAARRDVPVFLSVGYSTCHWCHVMERESFEDLEVAELLNERCVAIKLDREERPDVDAVFMDYVQVTTGHGGWPMSVFLTPDRTPVYGGTYFPARAGDRGAMPGFLTVLRAVDEQWRDPRFAAQGARIMAQLAARAAAPSGGAVPGPEVLTRGAAAFAQAFDPIWGGFGHAPKFPRPATLDFLLGRWRATGDAGLLEVVETTLDKMALGGLYDQVGGGFARYSVDERWLVPHFEKMLYDNAQLATTYVTAWQATGRELYARVAREVLDYLAREMTHPSGGLHSATDADSDGEEGLFFVWTPEELVAALGDADAAWVGATFGVTPHGNFEGRSILHLRAPLDAADQARWETLRWTLYEARARRVPPGLDDKILTSWNALAISAFARAGVALAEPDYVRRAEAAARFVLAELRPAGRLLRAWRGGKAQHDAVLEDYAALAQACLDLLEATGDAAWLSEARGLLEQLQSRFAAPGGGFWRTADDAEPLPVRERPESDGAEPSGNALAALALLRCAAISDDAGLRRAAEGTLAALQETCERAPTAVPKLLCALEWVHGAPRQVVIVTPGPDRAAAEPLLAPLRARFAPQQVVLVGPADGALAAAAPALFAGRTAASGRATAYVCEGTSCGLPAQDPEALVAQL
jgi:hypothetical protein